MSEPLALKDNICAPDGVLVHERVDVIGVFVTSPACLCGRVQDSRQHHTPEKTLLTQNGSGGEF